MKLKLIKGFYMPVIYSLYDDSNMYNEFSSFFKNGYWEWDFEEIFKLKIGLIQILDKSDWEDDAKLLEYALVEVNYLAHKQSKDPDFPYVHSFKDIGRIPITALEKGINDFLCFDIDPTDPFIDPDDYKSDTLIMKGRKKLL